MLQQFVSQFCAKLSEACERYEKTAPTVAEHCDDLYMRLGSRNLESVTLLEISRVQYLWQDEWLQPNYAANWIYKLREELGMPTTGHAGF